MPFKLITHSAVDKEKEQEEEGEIPNLINSQRDGVRGGGGFLSTRELTKSTA